LRRELQILRAWAGLSTLVVVGIATTAFRQTPAPTRMDEITVERINVVDADGTLRMVISNSARLPGVITRGKEKPKEDRPQAGMLFFNDEGSENGGLIFGGKKNAKGNVVDSGGSLSFDRYGANQVVQLIGVDDREVRRVGLVVTDSPSGTDVRRRVWVGRGDDGAATVSLSDGNGKKRIVMKVAADGASSIVFLDADGKVVNELK
jgi:hypothetical protein